MNGVLDKGLVLSLYHHNISESCQNDGSLILTANGPPSCLERLRELYRKGIQGIGGGGGCPFAVGVNIPK